MSLNFVSYLLTRPYKPAIKAVANEPRLTSQTERAKNLYPIISGRRETMQNPSRQMQSETSPRATRVSTAIEWPNLKEKASYFLFQVLTLGSARPR